MKKLQRIFYYIKRNWQKLFCYGLIMMGILLFMVVLIRKPYKSNNNLLYPNNIKGEKIVGTFPLKQHVKVKDDNLYGMYLYFGTNEINKFPYEVTLKDTSGKVYFKHKFNLDYEPNIVYMQFPLIKKSNNKEFVVTVDCESCNNVKLNYLKKKKNDSYIENVNDMTLRVSYDYYTKNNSYYWYSILSIVIGVTLLPLAKEEKYEK